MTILAIVGPIYFLGNLTFGGKIIMETKDEITIETPSQLFIRIPNPKKSSESV